jgi:hypothetical protein
MPNPCVAGWEIYNKLMRCVWYSTTSLQVRHVCVCGCRCLLLLQRQHLLLLLLLLLLRI